ncbi:MAG TPA: DUF1684 domain-containing protein [Gemmatimonadales bacterium]|nr:DUF1684 domain-containing protein [Gemmatimonadales bacterium]
MSRALVLSLAAYAAALPAAAQEPARLEAERAAFADWLATAPISPFAAVAHQPIGTGLDLGSGGGREPDGIRDARVSIEGGRILLHGSGAPRSLPRYRPTRLGRYSLVPGGTAAKPVLTVFDSTRPRKAPRYFDYDPSLSFVGPLTPPAAPASRRLLTPDGIEVEATEAGTVLVPLGGVATALKVMRIPDPATGESELEVFFRDSTNTRGTYPAGRFVALIPEGGGRYRLDFNRARNPFCAYSTAYACPLPWQGNVLPAHVRAGEQYVTD